MGFHLISRGLKLAVFVARLLSNHLNYWYYRFNNFEVKIYKINDVNKSVDTKIKIIFQFALTIAMEKVKTTFLINLGKRIAYLRERNGLNQAQLGFECYKDRQSINRLEKGNVNPSIFYLYQICKALNVSLNELFDAKELK